MTRKKYNADQTAEDMHEIVTTNQHNRKSVKQATRQTAEVTLFSRNHPGCYNSLKRLQAWMSKSSGPVSVTPSKLFLSALSIFFISNSHILKKPFRVQLFCNSSSQQALVHRRRGMHLKLNMMKPSFSVTSGWIPQVTLPWQGEGCTPARANCWGLAQEQNIISKILLNWYSGSMRTPLPWSADLLHPPNAIIPNSCQLQSTFRGKWQLLRLPNIVQMIIWFLHSQPAFFPSRGCCPFSTQILTVITCWSQCCTGPFPPGSLHTPWTGRSWLEWGHSQWHWSSSGPGLRGEPSRENLVEKFAWEKKKKAESACQKPCRSEKTPLTAQSSLCLFPSEELWEEVSFQQKKPSCQPTRLCRLHICLLESDAAHVMA